MKESVESDSATSRCVARVLMHVNIHPHRLALLLRILTNSGPKKSTPVWKKGGDEAATLHDGRSAIIVGLGFAREILHMRHCRMILLILDRHPTIHTNWRREARVYSLPA